MPRVDIIMPLYNKAATVGRAVESVRRQRVSDWRLIIVDDGSTDGGAELVGDLHDSRIEILTQPNQGPGPARNAGMARAQAPYVAFLDADDEWLPWHLQNALTVLEEGDVPMVAAMYLEWPQEIDTTVRWAKRGVLPGRYDLTGNENPELAESLLLFLHVGNTAVRTDAARKYDGFYDHPGCIRGEDNVFFMRIALNEPFCIITPAAVRHHREDSGLSNFADFPEPAFLADSPAVFDYCTGPRRELALKVFDRLALRTAHHWARNGFKERALALLERYPGAQRYGRAYRRCRRVLAMSRWMPYWVRLRCVVGMPLRRTARRWGRRLRLLTKLP